MMSELGKKGSGKRGVGLGSREDFAFPSLWSTEVQSTGSSDAVVCYPQEPRASKIMTESAIGY